MAKRKLTDDQVRQILCYEKMRAHHDGLAKLYKRDNIAKMFGVSYSVITAISEGSAYADVTVDPCDM